MAILRKLVRAQITALGDDEVEVVMSTDALARDGHILIPQGCQLENYRANPIALWSHDPDKPVGNAEDVGVGAGQLTARVRFAPLGISRKADEVRGLTKAGVIRAVSVGFDPIEMEPLDPKKPKGGQRILRWELLELSFVSVPADPGAEVSGRAADGETTLTETTVTATRAQPAAGGRRVHFKRGLYQVASLAYLFEELDWAVDMAKWEAECEGDDSKVPAMLAGALHELGDALLAMTKEEIAEALAGHDLELEDDSGDVVLTVEERQHIAAGPTPAARAWRRRLAQGKLRAGKTLSAATVQSLRDMKAKHEEGMEQARSALRSHQAGLDAVDDMMNRAGVAIDEDEASDTTTTAEDGEGERAAAAYRRRQADLLALSAT